MNLMIQQAIRREERAYARQALRLYGREMPQLFRSSYPYRGIYETFLEHARISASTVVVSALIPSLQLYPGGNDGSTWISVTLLVPSGREVSLPDLFSSRSRGLQFLAQTVKRNVLQSEPCIKQSISSPITGDLSARGFEAAPGNYRYFALMPKGLIVGMPNGQVGSPSCGRIEALVPYAFLRPHLSTLGRRLVAGIRRPLLTRVE
ncbi:MAG TPA: hypothetical protein VHU60_08755 [Gaiellaceae bacterium]|nr:hypothetical protein [Gaiellaceae bacterium]